MYELDLYDRMDTINELLARYGVKFGIYKNNQFSEQLFPFDAIPRVITKAEFDVLEKGLMQRVVFANKMTKEEKTKFLAMMEREPRRFIAQEVIDFEDLDIFEGGQAVPRKADLRAFVLTGKET